MAIEPAIISSKNTTWQTPDPLLDLVRKVHPIDYDPASAEDNPTEATFWSYQNPEGDAWTHVGSGEAQPGGGLSVDWTGSVFCNPPYGRHLPGEIDETAPIMSKGKVVGYGTGWAEKMAQYQGEATYLVAARPDTKAFRRLSQTSDITAFWHGRIKFKGAPNPAPFPSVLFYRGERWREFMTVFRGVAEVYPGRRIMEELMRGVK